MQTGAARLSGSAARCSPLRVPLKCRSCATVRTCLCSPRLDTIFTFQASSGASVVAPGSPACKHELALYLAGNWRALRFRPGLLAAADAAARLDVTLLQHHVLEPIFGVADPRTSDRINFIGGIRGTAELENLVNSGSYACAFSMFPTGIDDLMAIADAGQIMPPKSTWFEPKLRDGMFCHMI